jgi:hypothetical protein
MTRDELHDRFIREGAFPGTPKGRGLIHDLVSGAEVCEQATCEGCGHKGPELVTPTRMRLETTGLRSLCAQSVMRRLAVCGVLSPSDVLSHARALPWGRS